METGKYYPPGATDLLKAVAEGDNARIENLLKGGFNPNSNEPDGVAPVTLAAYLNRRDAVDLLAEHGAVYPRFAWIEDLWEYGKPEKYEKFRSGQHQIVEVSQAAIVHKNEPMLDRLLSLPGAERALLRKSALEAWSAAQFSEENRHRLLGPMCAKIIGTRIDLTEHEPAGLAKSLAAFYKGMDTFYNNRFEDVPHWETKEFNSNRSGLLSLPFSFWNVMVDLDRDYISRIKTNDTYGDTGIRFEWQPDDHTYVVAAQLESGPSSDDNDDGYARLTGRVIYSKNPDSIDRIARMLTAIRADDVDGMASHVAGGIDAYCGFGSPEDIARYAIHHGSQRVLEQVLEVEKSLHSSEVLNRLAKEAIKYANHAAGYAQELARVGTDDHDDINFLSDLDYDRTHDIVKTVVASANSVGGWLKLEEIGRYFIQGLLEDRPARHQELMEEIFAHLDSAPGLMEKVDGWGDQTGSMVRAWRAKSAVDRVLKSAKAAGAPHLAGC